MSAWDELERRGPDAVVVDGVEVRAGSRVRLRPRTGGDVLDLALAGRVAVVESIEQDTDDALHLVVTIEDDPGQDLGRDKRPGHRFFFSAAEVEPVPAGDDAGAGGPRILVAGIGNVFLADDGFGVALAGRLAARALPPGVEVRDFGIRGIDLAYAMGDGYDAVVLLDATPRGGAPGTLYVIEAESVEPTGVPDAHGMDPVHVLALAGTLGTPVPRTLIVGCEPQTRMTGDEDDVVFELSEPVRAALDGAVRLVESVLEDLIATTTTEVGTP